LIEHVGSLGWTNFDLVLAAGSYRLEWFLDYPIAALLRRITFHVPPDVWTFALHKKPEIDPPLAVSLSEDKILHPLEIDGFPLIEREKPLNVYFSHDRPESQRMFLTLYYRRGTIPLLSSAKKRFDEELKKWVE